MKHYLLSVIFLFVSVFVKANGLQITVTNVSTTDITFQISWENSWNINNLSRDAAWVFVKYQDCESANKSWDHLNLSTNSGDHSVGTPNDAGLQVDAVTDGKGVFIRRSAYGGGHNPTTAVTLKFASAFGAITEVNFNVIGIEMVYVPQGSFIAGDGSSDRSFGTNTTNIPYEITSEAGIAANGLANSSNQSWDWGNTHPAIPAAFPKGFKAFYCMKYEITQAQYCHFLNLLPAAHQAVRTAVAPGSASKTQAMVARTIPYTWRNYIQIKTPAAGGPPLNPAVYGLNRNNNSTFDEVDDGGNIACNFLSWNDLLAYLDWAAIRPMTELEYEKACRGPASNGPFASGIYAWGSTNLTQATNQWEESWRIANPGRPNEISMQSGDGLCNYGVNNDVSGPYRVGFAAMTGTSRQQAGATYYGIMEMSGNVAEQCYHIGRTHDNGNGGMAPMSMTATFEGVLGDGMLNTNGESNQSTWGLPIEYKQSILRGGSFINGSNELKISSRYYLHARMPWDGPQTNNRHSWVGGRGVRQY